MCIVSRQTQLLDLEKRLYDLEKEREKDRERLNRLENILILSGDPEPLDEDYTPDKSWFPELENAEEEEILFKERVEDINHDRDRTTK